MKVLVSSMLAFVLVAGPLAAQQQTMKKLKACGSEATNSFGFHKEYPAINEGNGYVGFQTEDSNADGTFERYGLVNCATRTIVRIEAEYLLKDSATSDVAGGDLFKRIKDLRSGSRLANETLLTEWAKARGFKVAAGNLPERGSEKAARTDCGCATFYPDM